MQELKSDLRKLNSDPLPPLKTIQSEFNVRNINLRYAVNLDGLLSHPIVSRYDFRIGDPPSLSMSICHYVCHKVRVF